MTVSKITSPPNAQDAINKINEIIDNLGGGASRNIGEIVASTIPLIDAGLHLLDGALIQGGGIYSAFVTYIAGLVSTYPDSFVSESDWQTAVTNYGVCSKFVYDSTNNTVRLPKYGTQIFTKKPSVASTVPVIGNGITLGLAQGSSGVGLTTANGYFIGYDNLYGAQANSTSASGYYNTSNKGLGISTDPSKSGMIANTTSLLTNYPLDCYYYIVIATSTKTDIEVDIDEVVTDLNGKADVDLTNVNNSGTSLGASWAMPSNTYTNLTLGASGTAYTAPANGWFVLDKYTGAANQRAGFYNSTLGLSTNVFCPISGNAIRTFVPCKKGEVYTVTYDASGTTNVFRFIYAEGSKGEA